MENYNEARVIMEKTSISTGVLLKDLCGPSRLHGIMQAKHQARKELREKTGLSLSEISILTGGSGKNSRIVRTNKAKRRQKK